jgi:hypothetical protein
MYGAHTRGKLLATCNWRLVGGVVDLVVANCTNYHMSNCPRLHCAMWHTNHAPTHQPRVIDLVVVIHVADYGWWHLPRGKMQYYFFFFGLQKIKNPNISN